jgi:hypothetical protein
MAKGFRRACSIAFLAAFMIAVPANAKNDASVMVEGPGLAGPTPFAPHDGGWLMHYSGFWRESCRADSCRGRASSVRPPSIVDLGPRYTLTWDLLYYRSAHSILHQDVIQYVYPFAQPRPVTYMPADQVYLLDGRTGGGWFIAGPDLLAAWTDLDLPATIDEAMGTAPSPSVASQRPWWILWAAVGSLIALLVVFLLARQGHDQASGAASPVA